MKSLRTVYSPYYITVVAFLCIWPKIGSANVDVYHWVPVANSSYYIGQIKINGRTLQFRTTMRWILTRTSQIVSSLKAYDSQGQLIANVQVKKMAILASKSKKSHKTSNSAPISYSDLGTSGDDEDYWGPQEDDSSSQSPTENQKPFVQNSLLSIQLGLGKEKLSSAGGLTKFDGSTNIGSTRIGGSHTFSPIFSIGGNLEGHGFIAVGSKTVGDEQKDEKFLRVSGLLTASAQIADQESPLKFAPGCGVAYTRIPVLKKLNSDTGATKFQMTGFSAFECTLSLSYSFLAGGTVDHLPKNLVSADAGMNLFTLGSGRFDEKRYSLSIVHNWLHNIFFALGLTHQIVLVSSDLPCASIEECKSPSSTQSKVSIGFLGGGINF